MRHRHGYRKLSRTSSHRKALLKNLAIALVEHDRIETTLAKAKEVRRYIEKLITVARTENSNAHRAIFALLQCKKSTKKLLLELGPRYKERTGGYTRIIKTRIRCGDASTMAFIEFV